MKLKLLINVAAGLALIGCSYKPHYYQTVGGTETLGQLHTLHAKPVKEGEGISSIRTQALQDTAMTLAAQSGLAWRSKQINEELKKDEKTLDQAFNFQVMLLDHNVLPPVLVEGRDELNLASPDTIRLADRVYKIESQARFVTAPPHWREYLAMDYAKPPPPPNATLLPKSEDEKCIWNRYVDLGWKEGIAQANTIFTQNLARLKRDYAGMVRYRKLLAQNMVSAPFVAHTDLGVTGGGSDMRVHDQVLRITALPKLRTDSQHWKPALSP